MAKRRRAVGDERAPSLGLPLLVAVGYVAVGAVWIAGSDRALEALLGFEGSISQYQTLKGWFYVLVTGVLLYVVLAAALRRTRSTQAMLDLALDAAGGGAWDLDLAAGEVFVSPHLRRALGLGSRDGRMDSSAWEALIHPDDRDAVAASARRTVAEPDQDFFSHYRLRHADGTWRWVQSRGHALRNRRGEVVRLTGITLDVTHLVEAEAAVYHQATYDPMTGLLYRDTFTRGIASLLAPDAEGLTPVVRLSIRRFSDINNAFGFAVGDEVLRRFARRVIEAAGGGAVVGRIAGDEFAVAYPDRPSAAEAERMVNRLLHRTSEPIVVDGQRIRLAVAIGVALHPSDGPDGPALMSAAGFALQEARESSDRPICYYAKTLDDAYRGRAERTAALVGAVDRGELILHYQPVIDLATERTAGFEALVRWNHPREGLLRPAEFIPIAESSGIIHDIGSFVLRDGCGQCARWRGAGGDFFLAVNLSPRQLTRPDLAPEIARVLEQTGWPAHCLELEITETAITEDFIAAAERLRTLRDLGVRIAIDDFGTGYSTFTSLLRLPITKIKIDRSFVARYGSDREATLIVDTVVQMAERLGMDTTAEGVETVGQARSLREAGCRTVQGFHYSRPMPPADAQGMLGRDWRSREPD